MELFFLALLVAIMATALGVGYPVAFALPGAAILTIIIAGVSGQIIASDPSAYFHQGGPIEWLSSGVTNLRGVYWEVERDTLIAIPLFIFMGIMLQKSKIAEDLLVVMANLFGPVPGGLGISVVFVGALLAATTGIVGATVVAMGLISLPAMLRNNYSKPLATGTIAASGTLGQIIPPSIVLIILADQLSSASDQAGSARKLLHKEATGEISMPSMFEVGSTSAGEMFLGALVPGIVLVAVYMLFILLYAIVNPKAAPAVRYKGSMDLAFWGNVFLTLVPPLGLIFLVLGSIITGVATVNQAGAIGASGALIMAGYRLTEGMKGRYTPALLAITSITVIAYCLHNYEMNVKAIIVNGGNSTGIIIGLIASLGLITALVWSGLRVLRLDNILHSVMTETAKTTSLVFIILLGAAMLTAAFRAFGGEDLVRDFLNSLPGGFWAKFAIVMIVIFVLGFFLDFIEIAVVVVPIVAPILLADPSANITAVWLGVMIGLNIQTSFLTPPFGFALFYLRGVAPAVVKTLDIYKGVVAFICLQLLALGIVGLYPQLVNYLPNRVSFLSESSPPPRNPKLQICLDEYSMQQLTMDRSSIMAAVAKLDAIDVSRFSKNIQSTITGSVAAAGSAIASLEEISVAEAAVAAEAEYYRPIQVRVRSIESKIRRAENNRKDLKNTLAYLKGDANEQKRAVVNAKIDDLLVEINNLQNQVPQEWDTVYEKFSRLVKSENKTRIQYRRAADQSYSPIQDLILVLNDNQTYFELKNQLVAVEAELREDISEASYLKIKDLSRQFSKVKGGSDVQKALSKVLRQIKPGKVKLKKAQKEYSRALKKFDEGEVWRITAQESGLAAQLSAYLNQISDSIGARQQPKLNRSQALYLAKCNAVHRDISLNF